MLLRLPLMAAVALAAVSGRRALAQGPTMSGRAANLVPLAPSELVLKSQTVELEFAPDEQTWHVDAHYELSNPSKKPLNVQVGFPEYSCSADADAESEFDDTCDPARGGLAQLDAIVDDKTIHLRKRRWPHPADPAAAAGSVPESVWAIPIKLGPGESSSIVLRYAVPAAQPSEGGFSVAYLLRSQPWPKPIGRATFKFSFPARSCLVVEPEGLPRKARRVAMHADGAALELVYEAYQWTPRSDLGLYFEPCIVPRDTELPDCRASTELASYFYPSDSDEDVAPISEAALRAALDKLSDADLEKCRDSVWNAYASYFQPSELKRLPPHPESNRHYTAPLLTAADWNWIHFLDRRLDERKTVHERAQAAARAKSAPSKGGCGCSIAPARPHPIELSLLSLLLSYRRRRRVRSR